MPADHDVVISLPAESARYDRRLRSIGTLDEFELIRHLFVEPSMHRNRCSTPTLPTVA